MIYMPYRKSITSFHPKLFSTFKNVFFTQSSSTRMIQYSKKASIQNIAPHCFGDHEKCDEKWCSGKFDASYKHKLLPYGRDLCGEEFKKDLNQVSEKHAKNADALSPNESTCANEYFNLLVASKAPKMHHYSKLENFDFRIASTVCQKNIG